MATIREKAQEFSQLCLNMYVCSSTQYAHKIENISSNSLCVFSLSPRYDSGWVESENSLLYECRKKKRHPQYGQIPIYIHIVESNSRGIESFYFIKFANKSEMLQWTWFYSFIIEFIVLHIVYVFFKMCMVAEQSVLQYIEQMTQNTCRSKRLLNFFSFIRAHLHIYTAMFAQRCQQYYP